MRYVVSKVPAYPAIRDTVKNETILTIVTKRDPVNGRDNSFLTSEEINARIVFILDSLNRNTEYHEG